MLMNRDLTLLNEIPRFDLNKIKHGDKVRVTEEDGYTFECEVWEVCEEEICVAEKVACGLMAYRISIYEYIAGTRKIEIIRRAEDGE